MSKEKKGVKDGGINKLHIISEDKKFNIAYEVGQNQITPYLRIGYPALGPAREFRGNGSSGQHCIVCRTRAYALKPMRVHEYKTLSEITADNNTDLI